MNFGTFTQPKLAGVPGIGSFKGQIMHTSRWDYDYTGGSSLGGLHKLADKRVAIVGTGATAIQVTPHVGEGAEHCYVFQRTPSSVDIRNQRKTTPEFAQEFLSKPGWQAERQQNFYEMVQTNQGAAVDLIDDGWTDIIRNQQLQVAEASRRMKNEGASRSEIGRMRRLVQFQQMEKVRD
jgi:cation diffusion facilitator CzcD-associated flavoprotein CzcO